MASEKIPSEKIPSEKIPSEKIRFHLIVLSDRASRGEYEDRSGPRAAELIEEFLAGSGKKGSVGREVIPDDRDVLLSALDNAAKEGADVIITSGSTGLGPSDIAPEATKEFLDKELPGVMEHIRTMQGAQNRRALLSRGLAGARGRTLVFNLPGSVKAVEEYLAEILPLVGHALEMLHGGGHDTP